jgi:hypothetical protein
VAELAKGCDCMCGGCGGPDEVSKSSASDG